MLIVSNPLPSESKWTQSLLSESLPELTEYPNSALSCINLDFKPKETIKKSHEASRGGYNTSKLIVSV